MFKFTGPFSIGKSITLIQYCRTFENAFYLNLKILKKKSEIQSYLMLKEEFCRASYEYFNEIQNLIEKYYYQSLEPIEAIANIMEYLSNKYNNNNFLFVLDQYKAKFLNRNIEIKISKLNKNIKIIYCSSINDNIIRDECLKTWNEYGIPKYLNEDNQKYYFYYGEIYNPEIKEDNPLKRKLKGITKYLNYFKQNLPKNKIIEKIMTDITEKIKEFCKYKKFTLDLVLINIKNIINKRYENSKLNDIILYCPLKFFIVKFYDNGYFKIKMKFPFLKYIINKKLTEEEVNNYFKDKKYINSSIENDSVKGDYFEYAVKYGLQKYIKYPNEINEEVLLKEIITMDKKEIENYESEEESDTESKSDENKEFENSNKMQIEEEKDIINSENEDDNEDKEEDEDVDEKDEDDNGKDNDNNNNDNKNINKNEKEQAKNNKNIRKKKIKSLLTEFQINMKKKIGNKYSIEYYRKKEIKRIKKNNEDIPLKNEFNGNKNYFIDQKKKKGRLLDYAILFGDKMDKCFIGFQIKCYFNQTNTINNKFINKTKIKDKCQKILFNSMILFNCKITKWFYFLIFYINKQNKEYNVNDAIINKCKGNIEILYYDPINKQFFSNDKTKPIEILELYYNSNLDNHSATFSMDAIDIHSLYKVFDNPQPYNEEEIKKDFINDFSFLKIKEKTNEKLLEKILEKIAKIMKIEGKLYLRHKLNDIKVIKIPPEKGVVFLYKKSSDGFIGVKTIFSGDKFDGVKYYDLNKDEKGGEIKSFYNILNEDNLYIYSLTIQKMKKTYKRNHNEMMKEYQQNEKEEIKSNPTLKYQ